MRREIRKPRPDYIEKVSHLGLTFHTLDGQPYWNEAAAYSFTPGEIATIEAATNKLHQMCLNVVEEVVRDRSYARLNIPELAWAAIERAWDQDPPAIYGRFDLCYDGVHPPKLLEYNADTPTSLLEAAVVQWHWLQEIHPEADQFNSIWEGLVAKWRALKEERYHRSGLVHFACMNAPEDVMTTAVLMDTAQEAGLKSLLMGMGEIAWEEERQRFVDPFERPIETLFKLYPWEWMLKDEFGEFAIRPDCRVQWMEPIWKMILSNKAVLALLWERYPGHPNLLPAYLDGPNGMQDFVRKPLLSREGANITLTRGTELVEVEGPYGDGPWVYQGYAPLPVFDGNHVVIGSWVIDGEARGIGIRESDGPITEDHARFVPHYFYPEFQ